MHIKPIFLQLLLLAYFSSSIWAIAEESSVEDPFPLKGEVTSSDTSLGIPSDRPSGIYDEVLVTGGVEGIKTTTGSATFLDEQAIEQFDSTNVNSLLSKVPGVYIRQEDGFGLRPNIGLRGTNSDRSSKITLMEDGILITPAPYSAPAAYYIPNVNRMSAVEVFKGPSVIQHGPHTIGGAINFVSRPIPFEREGEIGASVGSFGYQKLNGFYGDSFDQFGFWIDVLSYGADGFKKLDNDIEADTGFERNDINAKFQWNSLPTAKVYQEFQIKLGFADEEANETYLGLTDGDFTLNPNRRYSASQLDFFTSEHQQIQLLYSADFGNDWKFIGRAYQHDFERSWNKFSGAFGSDVDTSRMLSDDNYSNYLALFRGDRNSERLGSLDHIDVTNNAREYQSKGVQLNLEYSWLIGKWTHDVTTGIRHHNDSVNRDHLGRAYLMAGNELIFDDAISGDQKALNKGEVSALAIFIEDHIEFQDFTFNVGLRYEDIDSKFDERAAEKEAQSAGFQKAVLPSAGVHYQYSKTLGFLLGINYGFSSSAATPNVDVEPEVAINYEYGFRFGENNFYAEVIGFISDYSNFIGRCRASEACTGQEFNAEEAEIKGVELNGSYRIELGSGWYMPLSAVYTYTDGRFTEDFQSNFSQWGDVKAGDVMPYVPRHQGNVQAGVSNEDLTFTLVLKHTDKMKEAAGVGRYAPLAGIETDSLTLLDLSFSYQLNKKVALTVIVENVTDKQKIVSRRPYGARPNAPRMLKAGVSYRF